MQLRRKSSSSTSDTLLVQDISDRIALRREIVAAQEDLRGWLPICAALHSNLPIISSYDDEGQSCTGRRRQTRIRKRNPADVHRQLNHADGQTSLIFPSAPLYIDTQASPYPYKITLRFYIEPAAPSSLSSSRRSSPLTCA